MRQDYDLAPILRYENIAIFDCGKVRILDRRVYPERIEFVYCDTYGDVIKAIKDMVTQSAGPFVAGPMALALAAHQCRFESIDYQKTFLAKAANDIIHARPTSVKRMAVLVNECLKTAYQAMEDEKNTADAVCKKVYELTDERYALVNKITEHLAEKLSSESKIMTYCWGETVVGLLMRRLILEGRDAKFFCCETRPYFQGARLTASCAKDMGFDVTVITDGMPSFVMKNEGIDMFTTAADAICCNGAVINKVGTANTAIVAKYYGVPYYVTGAPEISHKTADDVVIEMRDPEFTLTAMGVRTAAEGVKGYYPSFDVTPPELVTGIATPEGIFAPDKLNDYFRLAGEEFKVIV